MIYYNEYGYQCQDKQNGKVTVSGLINLDGEEKFVSITIDKSKVDEVDYFVLTNQYLNNR